MRFDVSVPAPAGEAVQAPAGQDAQAPAGQDAQAPAQTAAALAPPLMPVAAPMPRDPSYPVGPEASPEEMGQTLVLEDGPVVPEASAADAAPAPGDDSGEANADGAGSASVAGATADAPAKSSEEPAAPTAAGDGDGVIERLAKVPMGILAAGVVAAAVAVGGATAMVTGTESSTPAPPVVAPAAGASTFDVNEAVRSAATAMESFSTSKGGTYAGATPEALRAIDATLPPAELIDVIEATKSTYIVTVRSNDGASSATATRSAKGAVTYSADIAVAK